MAQDEIHVGDIGTSFVATIQDGTSVIDISGATTIELIFEDPAGTSFTKTASFVTDGTDGKMEYVTVSDDDIIDAEGFWKIQGHVVFSATQEWKTDVQKFAVHQNI